MSYSILMINGHYLFKFCQRIFRFIVFLLVFNIEHRTEYNLQVWSIEVFALVFCLLVDSRLDGSNTNTSFEK